MYIYNILKTIDTASIKRALVGMEEEFVHQVGKNIDNFWKRFFLALTDVNTVWDLEAETRSPGPPREHHVLPTFGHRSRDSCFVTDHQLRAAHDYSISCISTQSRLFSFLIHLICVLLNLDERGITASALFTSGRQVISHVGWSHLKIQLGCRWQAEGSRGEDRRRLWWGKTCTERQIRGLQSFTCSLLTCSQHIKNQRTLTIHELLIKCILLEQDTFYWIQLKVRG